MADGCRRGGVHPDLRLGPCDGYAQPAAGRKPSEDLVDHIEQKVLSYPGVLGMHDLMVHDYGPGHQFASLHVELPAEQDPLEAQT